MLPIIGPTPNNGQSQSSNIQENDKDESTSSENPENNGADQAVKLDLGNSSSRGVHEKTAQMIVETKVRVRIEQSFSFSANESNNGEQATNGNGDVNPEETAKRLFEHAKSFFDGFLSESDQSESEGLEEFKETVREAIDKGFEDARQEIGEKPSRSIENLFEQVRTALDEYMDVFEGDEENEEATAEGNVADQNNRASQGNGAIPPGVVEQLSGTPAQNLTNVAG